MAFDAAIDLGALDGTNGFRLDGIAAGDQSGISVASAGDVNGDGYDDFIIGAAQANPNGDNDAGETYVVFGKAGGFTASFDLATLDGTNGFRLDGIDVDDTSGTSVSSAGDINGDGYDDLLIGAYQADPNGDGSAGETYVVFGKASGFAASLDLAALDGTDGFRLDGIDAFDFSGFSVASAGDVNGDGYGDILIGAFLGDPNGNDAAGETYLVFGKASGFVASLDLAALDGTTGFRLDGIDPGAWSGWSVATAGDVNGDGYDDILIGARQPGQTYVVFGTASAFAASFDLATLDGTNGFRLDGGELSGYSVASAGDVNGDGFDDILIGAYLADPNISNEGETHVVFGQASGFAASLDLATLDGTNGFRLDGIDAGDQSGISVASAGDVNGDGYDDILIGANQAAPNGDADAGETYLVFGSASGFAASFDLAALDGTNGFRLDGIDAGDYSGWSVSSAGDVNGDGYDDILVGAHKGDPNGDGDAGESFVIFGKTSNDLTATAGADTLTGAAGNDTIDGLGGNDVIDGARGDDDMTGGAGDDTFFVRDAGDEVNENDGEGSDRVNAFSVNWTLGDFVEDLYLFGRPTSGTGNALDNDISASPVKNGVTLNGLGGEDYLRGSLFGDTLNGGDDDDRLFGDNGDDTLNGDGGNDNLKGGLGSDELNGGEGRDILQGGAGADDLYGGAGQDFFTGGAGLDTFYFDEPDMAGASSGTADRILDFSQSDADLIDLSAIDAIEGDADDAFTFIGNAAFSGTAGELRFDQRSSYTMLQMDTDGDGATDFAVRLEGQFTMVESDFVL